MEKGKCYGQISGDWCIIDANQFLLFSKNQKVCFPQLIHSLFDSGV